MSGRIDHDDPRANMYGILPCPKCGNTRRWPTRLDHPKHPKSVICDDCGLVEAISDDNAAAPEE